VRGLPQGIVVDNGPEFISRALDIWAYRHSIRLVFIRPGKPVERDYNEVRPHSSPGNRTPESLPERSMLPS
jgi:transposase InsO family protein